MLDEEQRQYFELMESLFTHPAWPVLMDDFKGMQDGIAASWRKLTPDKLAYEQGRYEGLSQLTGFQEMLAELKKQAESLPLDTPDMYLEDENV